MAGGQPWYVRSLGVFLVTIAVSVATGWTSVAIHPPPWKVKEYGGLAVWTIPLAILVATAAGLIERVFGRRGLLRVVVALVAGVLSGIGYAFGCYYLSSGWVMAFDFPVIYCWMAGALAGFLVAAVWSEPRSLPTRLVGDQDHP